MTEEQMSCLINVSKQRTYLIHKQIHSTNYLFCISVPRGQTQCISPDELWEQVPPFLQISTPAAHAATDVEQFFPER